MAGELHEISAEIGALKKAVEIMAAQSERREEAATAGRRSLHDKFETFKDSMGLQVAGLSLRVDRMVDTLKEVEPAVQAFQDERLRKEGSQRLGAKLWAGLIAAAGVLGWLGHELFNYFKGAPHP